MLKHFQPSSTGNVLVVGDVILDRYVLGDTSRVSPEAPVPVVRVGSTEERVGGAANVAVNVRAMGVRTTLLGVTGDDDAADNLDRRLKELDVGTRLCRRPGFATTTKLRVLSRHQQLLRLDYESDAGAADGAPLFPQFQELLDGHDVVILSDYAKGSLLGVERYIAAALERGVPILVDPKGGDFGRYGGATLLTPNLREFEAVVGRCADTGEIFEKGRALCRDLLLGGLLVTRGERGMILLAAEEGEELDLPAHTHEVYDVTGAGDTVIGVVAAALASGYGTAEAVAYANLAAGLVVEKLGTATVTADELNRAALSPGTAGSAAKVLDREGLQALLPRLRSAGARIVFTNGCFDLLHAGHVHYLEQARALGDRLIVAVNDDASVSRLKGAGRPINPLARRLAVLGGLAAVDWVVPFSEDTPEDLIRLVQPDLLVKGGDYTQDRVVGADFVEDRGGEVVILPYREQCSTSALIDRIRGGTGEESG
jgi:D-beta-D-heptose 7-phosphate kinase/D-beta-D-heptose 1-phosphate adenosyltransferase